MKYEAYDCGQSRRGSAPERHWMVIENDGTEDGRFVGGDMTQEDAERIASLLNKDEG